MRSPLRPGWLRLPGIRLLSLHIFIELVSVFALSLGALLALLLIGRLLSLRELFLSQDLGFADIVQLLVYLSPFFLLLLMPIACMLAVFLTFLRMSTDRELVALKAGGVSLYQLLPAPVVFCLLCTVFNFWISISGLSWGMDNFRHHVLEFARTKTQLMLQPGVFNRDFKGLTLFAEKVTPGGGQLKTVFVRDDTRKDVSATIVAPDGSVATDPDQGQIIFLLRDGHIYRQSEKSLEVLGFETYVVRLDLSQLFRGYKLGDVKPKEVSWSRLGEMEKDQALAKRQGENFERKVRVERQKRLVLPVACLVLGLFALPLACAFQGLKQHLGLVLALACFLVYYTLLSLGLSLGEAGSLNPVLGLWLPDVLFALAAAVGIRLTAMERQPRILDWLSHFRLRRSASCSAS